MPKRNSLDSWIDTDRLGDLLNDVRPDNAERPSQPEFEPLSGKCQIEHPQTPLYGGPVETLLAEEIPERTFAKQRRPKLPAPEIKPNPALEKAKALTATPPPTSESSKPTVNPLTLYFHVPPGSLESRAAAFISWVKETASAHEAFVVDAYGAAIAKDPKSDEVFLASVSNLADALGRGKDHLSRPTQNALSLDLGDGRTLSLIQAKWDVATVALGIIADEPLHRDVAIRYRQELGKLARPARRRPRD